MSRRKPEEREALLLAIETSCDETAAAVVNGRSEVLANVVYSQMEDHQRYGGVVPEIASRKHMEHMSVVVEQALLQAGIVREEVDAIAVTQGPGLVGSLFVGLMAAKSLALAWQVPLLGVHHIVGHVYAHALQRPLEFPLLAVVVSGGHTELIVMRSELSFCVIGRSRDDAVGEAFDKVARALRLPYPGGPHIERLARQADTEQVLPRAWLEEDTLDFSFSGVKSAVMAIVNGARMKGDVVNAPALALGFQRSVVEVIVHKTIRAAREQGIPRVLLCGGVAANEALRSALQEAGRTEGIDVWIPPLAYCTDNAAMIGACGWALWRAGQTASWDIEPKSMWDIDTFGGQRG